MSEQARPRANRPEDLVNLFSGVTGGRLHLGAAAGIDTVTLEKPGATITVVWDQRPAAATARIPAGPGTAVYDKFGEQLPIRPQDGALTLHLAGSTDNTNSADPRDYVVGGSPLIVVQ